MGSCFSDEMVDNNNTKGSNQKVSSYTIEKIITIQHISEEELPPEDIINTVKPIPSPRNIKSSNSEVNNQSQKIQIPDEQNQLPGHNTPQTLIEIPLNNSPLKQTEIHKTENEEFHQSRDMENEVPSHDELSTKFLIERTGEEGRLQREEAQEIQHPEKEQEKQEQEYLVEGHQVLSEIKAESVPKEEPQHDENVEEETTSALNQENQVPQDQEIEPVLETETEPILTKPPQPKESEPQQAESIQLEESTLGFQELDEHQEQEQEQEQVETPSQLPSSDDLPQNQHEQPFQKEELEQPKQSLSYEKEEHNQPIESLIESKSEQEPVTEVPEHEVEEQEVVVPQQQEPLAPSSPEPETQQQQDSQDLQDAQDAQDTQDTQDTQDSLDDDSSNRSHERSLRFQRRLGRKAERNSGSQLQTQTEPEEPQSQLEPEPEQEPVEPIEPAEEEAESELEPEMTPRGSELESEPEPLETHEIEEHLQEEEVDEELEEEEEVELEDHELEHEQDGDHEYLDGEELEGDEEEDGGPDDIEIYEGLEENYELGKEIGSGGYSIVYEARDRVTDEMVAVKAIDMTVFEENNSNMDPLLPLKSEIRTMQRINHPNIVKFNKVFLDDEKFFIVMELMPSCEELFQRVERLGNYEEAQACHVFVQLATAVEYLHNSLGIAHRDLKPENILMCGSGPEEHLKLADFGFAKHFKEEQMKTALGSPGYAAPELFTDDTYDEKVDMWSLGVILYLMLCGSPPFYGQTIKELTDKIISVDFDFNDSCFDEVSEMAKDVICRLLIKDPKKRYSAQQLLDSEWMQGFE
eukprot:TRINITY_DN140_c0_g1_i2.p1 TRINITY_DN140_c0_g1~~TRINITY_DN140_c0_g1_i2.p1  ORF type:complete len:839 (+),score=298.40 TRINITY_DN140_c0_g1_i2:97-2517(+)